MPRNFFSPKTGHATTDAWLKNQPIFFDSDIVFAVLYGIVIGLVLATITIAIL